MKKQDQEMALLYFGAFTPDRPEYMNKAVSTAGNLFQINFLSAMRSSAFPTPEVYSYRPMPSFPKCKTLLYFGGKDRLHDGTRVRFLPYLNLGALKIVTLGLSCAVQVLRWARRQSGKRKVVIAYNLTAPPAWPIYFACKLAKCEFVPFIGDIYVPGEVVKDTWLRRREFEGQRRIIPKVDGLLVANRAIVEDFAQGRDSLLVEGGVPELLVRRFEREIFREDHRFHVVFAGQLSELNGIPLMLEAIAKVKGDNYRFSIAGGGEYAHAVKRAAEQDHRIQFHGPIPHSDVLKLYESADLLLNLRRTNNQTHRYVFPSKVVECLATGRPLLSTCTGHARTEFGDFVVLLENETADEVAQKIGEVAALSPEERRELGRKAQEYVRENRTWEANVIRLKDYLDQKVAA